MKTSLLILFTLVTASTGRIQAQSVRAISPDSVLAIINDHPDSGTIVINFWATWCGPCVKEMPYFIKADSLLKGENITFIFVSFDMPSKIRTVEKWVESKELPGAHYLINSADLDRFIGKVDKGWQGVIPYSIVLTKDDRENHEGSFETFKDLWNFIRK